MKKLNKSAKSNSLRRDVESSSPSENYEVGSLVSFGGRDSLQMNKRPGSK